MTDKPMTVGESLRVEFTPMATLNKLERYLDNLEKSLSATKYISRSRQIQLVLSHGEILDILSLIRSNNKHYGK